MTLILASASPIRHQMLAAAGVSHHVIPAAVDEDIVKSSGLDTDAIAVELAQAKALAISQARPKDWVVGSDSVVAVDGRRFDKPASRESAAQHLRLFSGKLMTLTSAAAVARGGAIDWSASDQARLQLRDLSEEFIQDYLDAEWPEVAYCVGVFRMEGRGVQLFDSIDGSHFTILGMPLLPLLSALRDRGVISR